MTNTATKTINSILGYTPTVPYFGYSGITGPLSNIRQDGSMDNAFHSFPDTLQGDDYSGDYGPNFLGMMLGPAVYVVDDPDVGLVAYGRIITINGKTATVQPRDDVRRWVSVSQIGVCVTISAGLIEEVFFDVSLPTSLRLRIVPSSSGVISVIVWVETPGTEDNYVAGGGQLERARGGWNFNLASGEANVVVSKL
ncbi:hypothetical protein N7463_010402 [Penicillium fimorum]|uniref:Uncharacterized protein n=1 Tax=Penicillium fimorum TaxID=1882269 RepID=A0A9W9XKQ8_9EURO|nr:hypothetical protein N7463_010402 [Penicillium fimorum]